ncbi:Neural-cadherin [Chionoecetes opilio]|uniref:Neural-cadherin n=1 Tax=Chionoecetes opilio TaxID=41210 RepID=A0A8J4YAZ8_CHIOP|nr:Neural-cadherin [Chionoecetes opilio]
MGRAARFLTPSLPQVSFGGEGRAHGAAKCQGSPGSLRCECLLGWGGQGCASPTTPTTFLHNSYVKLALSLLPAGPHPPPSPSGRNNHPRQVVCHSCHTLPHTVSAFCRQISHTEKERRAGGAVLTARAGQLVCAAGGRPPVCGAAPSPQTTSFTPASPVLPSPTAAGTPSPPPGDWATPLERTLPSGRDDFEFNFVRRPYGSAAFLSVDEGDGDLYNASLVRERDGSCGRWTVRKAS